MNGADALEVAADGYPMVPILPRMVHQHNRCSYPLHPTDNYNGTKRHRSAIVRAGQQLPPETPIVIVPHWQEFAPGEWRWCPRCRRRNTLRLAMVKKLYEASLTVASRVRTQLRHHPKIADWGRTWTTLGGRFATKGAQTVFADQHAPEGMAWCRWSYHYVAMDAMAPRHTKNKNARQCIWCYKRYIQHLAVRKNWRAKTQQAADLQQLRAVMAQITAAKRELADLLRLKEAVAQEIVAMQRPEDSRAVTWHAETETHYDSDRVLSGEAMTGPLPSPLLVPISSAQGGARRDRRKAYSL